MQSFRYLAAFALPLFVMTLLVPARVQAAGWVTLPVPETDGYAYTGLSFFSTGGVAVTGTGDMVYTADGGETWSVTTVASGNYNDVVMTSATMGVAVGTSGVIAKTNDGGVTWNSVSSPTTEILYAVAKYSATVYAVGTSGTVLRSTDSGGTWSDVSFGETRDFYAVDIIDSNNLWAVGEDGMAYQWTSASGWFRLDISTTYDMRTVSAADTTRVWVAGSGEFMATLPSGSTTWTQLYFDDRDTAGSIPEIVFTSTSEGYAARVAGCLLKTSDAGVTWSAMSGTCDYLFTEISILPSSGEIFAAGILESDSTTKIVSTYDDEAPTVSTVNYSGDITAGSTSALIITASDNVAVASCTLLVDGASAAAFTDSGSGVYTVNYTFSTAGNVSVSAQCTDSAANTVSGAARTLSVAAAEIDLTDYADKLIKTACASEADVNDPCKAVYYVTVDGQRHAFPNEKVYFTWYSDFDDVVTVDSTTMAAFTLGKNVTYKPGVTMVKFVTVNTVYTVSAGGVLQAVGSEAIAASLYGSDWNTNDVDDINDAFYTNYTFGSNINTAGDYNVDAALTGTTTIEENF